MLLFLAAIIKGVQPFLLVLFTILNSFSALAKNKNSSGGFLDFNLYPHLSDVETDTIFTLNIASKLPK